MAICVCARSLDHWKSREEAAFYSLMLPSVEATVSEDEKREWDIRLYVAIDDDDAFFKETVKENEVKWPPIIVTEVKRRRNKIPFNENAKVAYDQGAAYFVRINDDTEFVTNGWITAGTKSLKEMVPENVGVVGPVSARGGDNRILTHDMTHRNHMLIFKETYYAPEFSAWWVDDWITEIYRPDRMKVVEGWEVVHHTAVHGTRYTVQANESLFLQRAVKRGKRAVEKWVNKSWGENDVLYAEEISLLRVVNHEQSSKS